MAESKCENVFTCSVGDCGEHELNGLHGWCTTCREFVICGQRDAEHEASLLYWEGCSEHESGGYSVCIKCATKAFKRLATKNGKVVMKGEEHCICPVCDHDYGLLKDLVIQPQNYSA